MSNGCSCSASRAVLKGPSIHDTFMQGARFVFARHLNIITGSQHLMRALPGVDSYVHDDTLVAIPYNHTPASALINIVL